MQVDRRILFALVFLGVAGPLLIGLHLPVAPTDEVKAAYDQLEQLAAGQVVLVSFSYGPSTATEMQPMAQAILHHAFRRELKVVAICLWPDATGLAQAVFEKVPAEFDLEYGVDYVFLGYKPGTSSVILNMGHDVHGAFPQDNWGTSVGDLELMRSLRSLRDFDLVFDLGAGDSIEFWWIPFGQEKYGFPFAAGCTAVMAPDLYPFLNSGQLVGLLGGLAGAAEYEVLIDRRDKANKGMFAQSVTHLVIVAFVIFGNIAYFAARRGRLQQES
ncbi:MAG: hypothetical protein OXN90_05050 [Gemmatimonadota bacterium]|nr:hypothetical protein [Gemmatimonadota bacterium]